MSAAVLLGRSVSNLVHHDVREAVRRSAERRPRTTNRCWPGLRKPGHHAQDRRHVEVDLCRRAGPPPVAFSYRVDVKKESLVVEDAKIRESP